MHASSSSTHHWKRQREQGALFQKCLCVRNYTLTNPLVPLFFSISHFTERYASTQPRPATPGHDRAQCLKSHAYLMQLHRSNLKMVTLKFLNTLNRYLQLLFLCCHKKLNRFTFKSLQLIMYSRMWTCLTFGKYLGGCFSADGLGEWHCLRPGTPSSLQKNTLQLTTELPPFPCPDADWEKVLLEWTGCITLGEAKAGSWAPRLPWWAAELCWTLAAGGNGKTLQRPVGLFCGVLHCEQTKMLMPMRFYAEDKVCG